MDQNCLMNKPTIIGIAGGTGSGKTTIARRLRQAYGDGELVVVEQDAYYKDLSPLPFDERSRQNFDHPNAIDIDLLHNQLSELIAGGAIEIPNYDFSTHSRSSETTTVTYHHVIVIEGILALHYPLLREMMDIKIYVETPADIRFIRRLKRDINKRGRTRQAVVDQYLATVRPMHQEFVQPSKQYADLIIPEGGKNEVAMEMLTTRIDSILLKN